MDNVFSTCLCVLDGIDENNNRLQNVLVFCKRVLLLSMPSATHKHVKKRLTVDVGTTDLPCIGWMVWKWRAMTTSVAVMMIARDRTIFTSLNDCNMTLPFGWANGRREEWRE